MSKDCESYIGNTFYSLTVLGLEKNSKNQVCFICICECGNRRLVRIHDIKHSRIKSCGCKRNYYAHMVNPNTGTIITQARALEVFEYREGMLFWKKRNSNRVVVGKPAISIGRCGYKRVGVDGFRYLVHQVIFLMHYGYIPDIIDHIDRDINNNKINNLRPATTTQNNINAIKPNKSSGCRGVSWSKQKSKWRVTIRHLGKQVHIGFFSNIETAVLAYNNVVKKYHGDFAVYSEFTG